MATSEPIKDHILREYTRCCSDPAYFLTHYCYIQTVDKGRMLFGLHDFQEDAIHTFQQEQYVMVLKARQIGITTVVSGYALWMMLFHKDQNILIIATKQETAKNIITKVKFAFDNLPKWFSFKFIENNKLSIRLANGSQIKAASSTAAASRGESLNLLIIDEAAHIANAEEVWTAAQATLGQSGTAIALSSPNGIGNWFYMKYMEAEEYKGRAKQGAFFPVKLDWKVLPSYNQAWREEQDIRLGPQKARQEFDAAFVGSGNTVIDADLIEFYRETYVRDPELKMGPGGDVWVWEQPDYTKSYICVSDVARGEESKDGDYSAFHVIDAKTCAQVAEYKGRIGTTEYGNLLVAIATQYNDALLVIERENVGWAVIQQVINRQYKNLFYMTDDLKVVDEQHRWNTRFNAQEKKALPGFGTSSRTRPLIISKLDTYMREKSVIIRSQRTINELHTFVWENGKAQAAPSMNDDLILSLCIGLWVRDTALELHTRGIEYSKLSLDKMHRPQTYDAIYTGNINRENPYRFNIANGMEFDLRNLF